MVLPDLMESEDNLNEYIKLRNIEGKVPIKKLCKDENFEIDKDECINANLIPIDYNIEKLEINNLDDSASTEQESLVESDNKCDRKTPEIEKVIFLLNHFNIMSYLNRQIVIIWMFN